MCQCRFIFRYFCILSLKEKQEEQLLTALPPPTPLQIQAIDVAIEKVVQEFGLNNDDVEQRLSIKTAMENVLHQKLPGNAFGIKFDSCILRVTWSDFKKTRV